MKSCTDKDVLGYCVFWIVLEEKGTREGKDFCQAFFLLVAN